MKDLSLHDDMLLVHLTVGQLKSLFDSKRQEQSSSSQASSLPDIIDISTLADWLGYEISTIHALTHERKLPFLKLPGGRKLFFETAAIRKLLRENRVETNDEFVRNHRKGGKPRLTSQEKNQARLRSFKLILALLTPFYETIVSYRIEVEELKDRIAEYEAHKLPIENLLNDQPKP